MNILVLGNGGREHSLCWKISKSPRCENLFCIPGNGGIEQVAKCVDIDPRNKRKIYLFCKDNKIDLVVIGPELLLEEGLSDYLITKKIKVFGAGREICLPQFWSAARRRGGLFDEHFCFWR